MMSLLLVLQQKQLQRRTRLEEVSRNSSRANALLKDKHPPLILGSEAELEAIVAMGLVVPYIMTHWEQIGRLVSPLLAPEGLRLGSRKRMSGRRPGSPYIECVWQRSSTDDMDRYLYPRTLGLTVQGVIGDQGGPYRSLCKQPFTHEIFCVSIGRIGRRKAGLTLLLQAVVLSHVLAS